MPLTTIDLTNEVVQRKRDNCCFQCISPCGDDCEMCVNGVFLKKLMSVKVSFFAHECLSGTIWAVQVTCFDL